MQYLAVPTPDVSRPLDLDERQARIVLSLLSPPESRDTHDAITRGGAVEAAAIVLQPNLFEDMADNPSTVRQDMVDRVFRLLSENMIEAIIPGDPEWPSRLDELRVPPVVLYARGNVAQLDTPCAAIVGSRASTAYGNLVAESLGRGLNQNAVTVVSGGAYGIDAAAHRGALQGKGATIAVLAGGLDSFEPRENRPMFERILESHNGLVVSETPPGLRPNRWRFLARDRIIVALSSHVTVVEAGRRSGSRATANRALDMGRPVGAVPGPITSVVSLGTGELLKDSRVRAVIEVGDILNHF